MKKTGQEGKWGTKMVQRGDVIRKEWVYTPSEPLVVPKGTKTVGAAAGAIAGLTKKGSVPKLKNFFASEPSCVVHGSGKQCVTGKAPSFSKKAEFVFNKIAIPRMTNIPTLIKDLEATKAGLKNLRELIKATTDTKALTRYMKREKILLDKESRLNSKLKN